MLTTTPLPQVKRNRTKTFTIKTNTTNTKKSHQAQAFFHTTIIKRLGTNLWSYQHIWCKNGKNTMLIRVAWEFFMVVITLPTEHKTNIHPYIHTYIPYAYKYYIVNKLLPILLWVTEKSDQINSKPLLKHTKWIKKIIIRAILLVALLKFYVFAMLYLVFQSYKSIIAWIMQKIAWKCPIFD